jgi:hypothetical protein
MAAVVERADAFVAEHGRDAVLCRAVIEGRDVAAKALRARTLPAGEERGRANRSGQDRTSTGTRIF